MKVLLTGANGYIGRRLLPVLVEQGHDVVCAVRNTRRFSLGTLAGNPKITVIEIDWLDADELPPAATEIDAAYYLIHSMGDSSVQFQELEERAALNFVRLLDRTPCSQILYLGGITNADQLSQHLASRKRVEQVLRTAQAPVTAIKAGIIVGSGSSSFEIIRDLVEKLPLMVAPKWVNTRTQPVAIANVIEALTKAVGCSETYGGSFDIGGPDVLTYKEMLLGFAEMRGLKRRIWTVPFLTPRLSSYWLYFVTSTSYRLAVNLVNSMSVEVVAEDDRLFRILGIQALNYREALDLAVQEVEQNAVVSSWKDSLASSFGDNTLLENIEVPRRGCFVDRRSKIIEGDPRTVLDNIWSIGGTRGWYYANFLWSLRGWIDKLFGGVGLRRGRTSLDMIFPGDSLDFWRVLIADREARRLLLYAEMRLPGEAWLEFRINDADTSPVLEQTATFRPRGVLGRLYWYAVLPFHFFVFDGMAQNLVKYKTRPAIKKVVGRVS